MNRRTRQVRRAGFRCSRSRHLECLCNRIRRCRQGRCRCRRRRIPDATVHVVTNAIAIHVGVASAAAHAEGVELVSVAVAVSIWNVCATAFVDVAGPVADSTGVQRSNAASMSSHTPSSSTSACNAATDAEGVQLVSIAVHCGSIRSRPPSPLQMPQASNVRRKSTSSQTPSSSWSAVHVAVVESHRGMSCIRIRRRRRVRCRCRRRRSSRRSRPRRRTRHLRPRRRASRRRRRRGRRAGCRCSRSLHRGCPRIRIRRCRQVRCKRRRRRRFRRSRPRRRTRRLRPHLRCMNLRTRRGRRVGCRCNRSLRLGCLRIRTRRCRQGPLQTPHASNVPTQLSTSSQTPSPSVSAEQVPPQTPRASSWFPLQSQSSSGMSVASAFVDVARSIANATGVKRSDAVVHVVTDAISILVCGHVPPHTPRASSWLPPQSQSPSGMSRIRIRRRHQGPLQMPQASNRRPTQSSTSSQTPSPSTSACRAHVPPHTPRASYWFQSQSQKPGIRL